MRKYAQDPQSNPKPKLRVESIKEYREVVETLYKIVAGSTTGSKTKESALFGALQPKQEAVSASGGNEEEDVASMIEASMESENG